MQRSSAPASVTRQLRQEAGFGCVNCGHPFVEYHHIVPYHTDNHYRPDDMMAICPNCHASVGKLSQRKQREIKNNPYNIQTGQVRGALIYDQDSLQFQVGGAIFNNVPVILQHGNLPIISAKKINEEIQISLNLSDENANDVLKIQDNEILFSIKDVWDFSYHHNYVMVHSDHRRILLELDFRKHPSFIRGDIWLGGRLYKFTKDKIVFPGNLTIYGGNISNGPVGIQV